MPPLFCTPHCANKGHGQKLDSAGPSADRLFAAEGPGQPVLVGGNPAARAPNEAPGLPPAVSPPRVLLCLRMMINDIFTVSGRVLFWEIKILVQAVCST